MNVLVIGGNQYFGRTLVESLVRADHKVTVFNRGNIQNVVGASFIAGDRNRPEDLARLADNTCWDRVFDQLLMSAPQAELAVTHLLPRAGHYVMISSQSVYATGLNLKEDSVLPHKFEFVDVADPKTNYGEAKRQAEAVLARAEPTRTSFLRMPIVLAKNDPSERLLWHIKRILKQAPIYFPNLQARMSFIHRDDAAAAAFRYVERPLAGPMNLCSKGPVLLHELLRRCEEACGFKANLVSETASETEKKANWSPFGAREDWTLSLEKATSWGWQGQDTWTWMDSLIAHFFAMEKEKSP